MRELLPPGGPDDVDPLTVYALPARGRTHVRVCLVSGLDGAATVAGTSAGLSSPEDRTVVGALRTLADVVLVGAGTVRREAYGPIQATPARRAARAALGLPAVPPYAIVSASLELDPAMALFARPTARPIVLTVDEAPPERIARLEPVADVLVAGSGRVDARRALDLLAARGLTRVLCEGGPTLFTDLLAADLVDEVCLTLAPVLAGGEPRLTSSVAFDPPKRLRLTRALAAADGSLMLRYTRPREG